MAAAGAGGACGGGGRLRPAHVSRRSDAQSAGALRTLAVCRLAALALLLVLLFQPVADVRIEVPLRSSLLVLVDDSASMAIADTRKDVDQLAEAAMALGKVPGDDPGLRRAADSAARSMREAAEALADGRGDDARRAQEKAVELLPLLRQKVPASLPPEMLAGLETIAKRQEDLKTNPPAASNGSTSEQLSATLQSKLAGDLIAWYHAARRRTEYL